MPWRPAARSAWCFLVTPPRLILSLRSLELTKCLVDAARSRFLRSRRRRYLLVVHYAASSEPRGVVLDARRVMSRASVLGLHRGRLVPSWIGVVACRYVRLWQTRSDAGGPIVLAHRQRAVLVRLRTSPRYGTASASRRSCHLSSFSTLRAPSRSRLRCGRGCPKVPVSRRSCRRPAGSGERNLELFYRTRPDFATEAPGRARRCPMRMPRVPTGSTGPGDVILADDWTALHIIVPLAATSLRHERVLFESDSSPRAASAPIATGWTCCSTGETGQHFENWPGLTAFATLLRQAALETEDRLACCIDRVWTSASLVAYRLRQWPEGPIH